MAHPSADSYIKASELISTTRRIMQKIESSPMNYDDTRNRLADMRNELEGYRRNVSAQTYSGNANNDDKESGRSVPKKGDRKSRQMLTSKSSRRFKTELKETIARLEKEIDELTLANEVISPNWKIPPLDIASTAESSPIKHLSINENNHTRTYHKSSNRIPSVAIEGRTYRVSDVNRNIVQTNRIINKGLRTTRELNKQLGMIIPPADKKSSRDVALQVSLTDESEDEYAIAEKLTSFLIERSPPLVRTCGNVNSLVVLKKESPVRSRLSVQRLPDSIIPNSLSCQQLPCINIKAGPGSVCRNTDNVKMFVVNHCNTDDNSDHSYEIPVRDSSVDITKKPANGDNVHVSFVESNKKPQVDVSLQVDLISRSSSSTERVTLEKRISEFVAKYKNHQTDVHFNNREDVCELVNKVRSTGRDCEKYMKLLKLHSDVDLISELHPPRKSSHTSNSASNAEIYQSDFEVESLVQEEHAKSVSEDVNMSYRSSASLKSHSTPPNKKSPRSNIDDESMIEMQMKRLGMSPERLASRRTSSQLKRSPSHSRMKVRRSKEDRSHDDSTEDDSKKLYMKSRGKYIPIKPAGNVGGVQIVVPEIVVKMPESRSCGNDMPLSSPKDHAVTHDQLIQTDEGCGTMTSGDTSSIVEKRNARLASTQFLLERMMADGDIMFSSAPNNLAWLPSLHRRVPDDELLNLPRRPRVSESQRSPGETIPTSSSAWHDILFTPKSPGEKS